MVIALLNVVEFGGVQRFQLFDFLANHIESFMLFALKVSGDAIFGVVHRLKHAANLADLKAILIRTRVFDAHVIHVHVLQVILVRLQSLHLLQHALRVVNLALIAQRLDVLF